MYWLLLSALLTLSYEKELKEKTFWIIGVLFGYYLWKRMYDPDKKTIEKNNSGNSYLWVVLFIICVVCSCSCSFSGDYRNFWFNDNNGLIFSLSSLFNLKPF